MVINNKLVIIFKFEGDGRDIDCLVNRERDISYNDDCSLWAADLTLLDGDKDLTTDEYLLMGYCDENGNPTTEDMFIRVDGGRKIIEDIKILECE